MKKAAVIGFPISHSLSPILHNFLLQKHQIEGSYEAIAIDSEDLEAKFDNLMFSQDYEGLNVTIPYKEEIYKLFEKRNYKITQKAKSVGAINTIYKENGDIIGSNSDIYGFEQNLLATYQGRLKTNSALLIGAGGAASAALYSLSQMFDTVYIMNRNRGRAENLARNIENSLKSSQKLAKVEIISKLTNEITQNLNLVVNATSIGMKNQGKHSIDIDQINNDCIIYDLVYNPLITNLLIQAQNSGKPILTGIAMLIYQAFEGFEKWFGVKPELSKDEITKLSDTLISHIN